MHSEAINRYVRGARSRASVDLRVKACFSCRQARG